MAYNNYQNRKQNKWLKLDKTKLLKLDKKKWLKLHKTKLKTKQNLAK